MMLIELAVSFPQENWSHKLNERCDLISNFEKVIQDMNKLGRKYSCRCFYYMRNMNTYLNLEKQKKHKVVYMNSYWNENLYDILERKF